MDDDLSRLRERAGTYAGHGIDHEDQPFHGELSLTPLLDGRAIALRYCAEGIDGAVYHDEHAWIGRDEQGHLALWSVHTNADSVLVHEQRNGLPAEGAERTLVFGHGDPSDPSALRVEVALDLWPDGAITYRHAWGLPGGAFSPRSKVRMTPTAAEE